MDPSRVVRSARRSSPTWHPREVIQTACEPDQAAEEALVRVTDRGIFESARASTARAQSAAQDAVQQVSSGTRIHHPGDDPTGAGMMVAFQMSSDRLGAIAKAATAAAGELNAADSALGDIGNAVIRARELAVQGTNPSTDGQAASVEVAGLIGRVIRSLNTQSGNRYIFGGSADASAPFRADGTYAGNADARTVEVAPGVWQPASLRADLAMGTTGGGTNVIATLQALQAALAATDPAAVSATLGGLKASLDQVGTARAEVGIGLQTFDMAATVARNASTDAQTLAAQQGEVDLAQAATRMQATQTALQATLAAAAQSFKVSLLDYLR
jgi:flagellar hook-associated protein 3 FlgL